MDKNQFKGLPDWADKLNSTHKKLEAASNPFKGIPDWADKLNSTHKKFEAAANPFKGISEIASTVNQYEAIFGIAHQLNGIHAQTNKHNSVFDQLFSSSRNVYKITDAMQQMSEKADALQIVLGGSTISTLAKFTQESRKFSANNLGGIASDIHDKFRMHSGLFERQLSLTEQLSKGYFSTNHLAIPLWVDKITQTEKRFDAKNVNLFDVLSAETLTRLIGGFRKETEEAVNAEGNIEQITDLLNQNSELKKELENLYLSFAKHITGKLNRRKKLKAKDLKEPSKLFTEFIHKHLFKNTGISLQTVFTFVCLIEYAFTVIFIGMIMEAKGKDMFDGIFGVDSEQMPQQQIINNKSTYNIVNNYNNITSDFVIKDVSVYLRNSTKTKCIGKIKRTTTVLILSQKPKWCFIEAVIEKYDIKTKTTIEKVVRGWILNEYLDYFQ